MWNFAVCLYLCFFALGNKYQAQYAHKQPLIYRGGCSDVLLSHVTRIYMHVKRIALIRLITSLLLMKSLNKTDTPIFLSVVCSFFPKAIFLTFIIGCANGLVFTVHLPQKQTAFHCFVDNMLIHPTYVESGQDLRCSNKSI